ncbi:MAG: hypothetical protein ABIB11_03840 [Candidatus Omnitrophota bacterium]
MKCTYIKNLLLICIIVITLISGSVLAQDIGLSSSDLNSFMIPEAYGTIRESYFSPQSKGIVVHIQDLHCNYDAQMSISNIIDELIDKYNLKLVTVEGSVGQLDTQPAFSQVSNKENREILADFYVRKGRIGGAAYSHIMNNGSFAFFGADDKAAHKENVKAFKSAIEAREDTSRYYKNISSILQDFKNKVYSPQLLELDKNIIAYKSEDLGFSDYVSYLGEQFDINNLNQEEDPNFTLLRSLLVKEADIDFLEVDTQRSEYMDELHSFLEEAALSELVDRSLRFKLGKITALDFYSYIEEISKAEGAPELADYPQLQMYIEYVKLYSEIDNIKLFDEIENIETALKEKFFRNDIERKLDRVSYNLELLKGLFDLKLVKEDVRYFRDNLREFRASYAINFLTDISSKYKIKFKLDPVYRKIDAKLPDLEKFYRLAEERDGIMVNKTLDKMRENGLNIAVLIAGGFHTKGITTYIREKGYSYIVLTPKVENLQPESVYLNQIYGRKSFLEQLFVEMSVK